MTAIGIVNKIILNLSGQKLNKHRVSSALKEIPSSIFKNQHSAYISCYYDIIVGMYVVRLWNKNNSNISRKKWNSFYFNILTKDKYNNDIYIDLNTDSKFSNQYWASYQNEEYVTASGRVSTNAKCLADIIIHCNRLDSLRCFL